MKTFVLLIIFAFYCLNNAYVNQWIGNVNLVDLSNYTNPQSSFYKRCHQDGVKK